METVKYKGYEGTVEIDPDRGCFGKILFINDLVTYESDDIKNVHAEFAAAVDDYIQTCKELGREPNKSYKKGLFNLEEVTNVRHLATMTSSNRDISLNGFVRASVSNSIDSSRFDTAMNIGGGYAAI